MFSFVTICDRPDAKPPSVSVDAIRIAVDTGSSVNASADQCVRPWLGLGQCVLPEPKSGWCADVPPRRFAGCARFAHPPNHGATGLLADSALASTRPTTGLRALYLLDHRDAVERSDYSSDALQYSQQLAYLTVARIQSRAQLRLPDCRLPQPCAHGGQTRFECLDCTRQRPHPVPRIACFIQLNCRIFQHLDRCARLGRGIALSESRLAKTKAQEERRAISCQQRLSPSSRSGWSNPINARTVGAKIRQTPSSQRPRQQARPQQQQAQD